MVAWGQSYGTVTNGNPPVPRCLHLLSTSKLAFVFVPITDSYASHLREGQRERIRERENNRDVLYKSLFSVPNNGNTSIVL